MKKTRQRSTRPANVESFMPFVHQQQQQHPHPQPQGEQRQEDPTPFGATDGPKRSTRIRRRMHSTPNNSTTGSALCSQEATHERFLSSLAPLMLRLRIAELGSEAQEACNERFLSSLVPLMLFCLMPSSPEA